jgi:hypothetical protein
MSSGILPLIQLEGTLASILADMGATTPDFIPGYFRITLCGYGPIRPTIPGTCHLADAGVPQVVPVDATTGKMDVMIYGNDVIDPPGTFYEVAVLDQNKDVVQANNFLFTGSGLRTLSVQTPIIPPYGFPIGDLAYLPCVDTGDRVHYTAQSAQIVGVTYNGVMMPQGLTFPPYVSYTVSGSTITMNLTTDVGDRIDAFCVL